MSTPQDVVDKAIAAIRAALPELREVAEHPGRFDLDEAKRIFAAVPGVRVAFLGVSHFERDPAGYLDAVCTFAAVIATNASGQQAQSAASFAAAIACAIAVLADRNDWGLDGVDAAQVTRIDNLYGAAVDSFGLALWGVAWSQIVRLGEDAFFAEGVVPSRIYVGIHPATGAAHKANYEDVRTGEAPDA
ncbi:conserved hypothetical protein [uncultured Alphaproteobacteria bacterium]|uniref:Uncharacterized protein n=1 Tax=uncultured Alphaproteobacteria bacterium TaxID=91750 RepID=A0A212KN54_9PROT|nr:conserved hypothetical protein [uncultured Alphaproteobacteria bacterium]